MSSTFGQPGFVSSNRTGSSGVSQQNIGSLGSGVLQTIEESAAAQLADVFYYDKSVGYYNLPAVQRSHGDDYRTMNITTFGSRGTLNLNRKYFDFGPSCFRFQLPIDYAWSGCEYVANYYTNDLLVDSIGCVKTNIADTADAAYAQDEQTSIRKTIRNMSRPVNQTHAANGGKMFFESSGCSTMLPTSFQSGGLAFAFPQQIELNMGGAGLLQFDRYSNWAAIMLSCPFQQQRADLMRMAGGGLSLDSDGEAKTMPVKWGLKPWCTSTGTQNQAFIRTTITTEKDQAAAPGNDCSTITAIANANTASESDLRKYVPIAWDVLLPIKTPQTNFMYSLERRKPFDTSCLASDFQFTLTWSNFDEWSDTGKGYPNAPVYHAVTKRGLNAAGDVVTAFGTETTVTSHDTARGRPHTGAAPIGYHIAAQNSHALAVLGGEIGTPVLQPLYHSNYSARIGFTAAVGVAADPATAINASGVQLGNSIAVAPTVWTNHYRVASGQRMSSSLHYAANDSDFVFNQADGTPLVSANVGRVRLPQLISYVGGNTNVNVSQQLAADQINSNLSYPSRFSLVEYINSSLKLVNPALGAYNALRVDKEAVLYYPFQYFYSQIYRITTHPYQNFTNVSSANLALFASKLEDPTAQSNKITQMIQMPANPCTALVTGLYREKDRQQLVRNKLNSYSPVLFWNALNPIRMDLKDGGNTLFSYRNNVDFEMYSLMDRPDALKIPFRGGHVKVQPKNLYGSRYLLTKPGQSGRFVTGAGATYSAGDITQVGMAPNSYLAPFWYTSLSGGGVAGIPAIGVGFQGVYKNDTSKSHPTNSVNSFMADDLCNSICLKNGLSVGGGNKPCHTTDWYEATLVEFPFVMAEPLTTEKIVQQTPSFARTQLELNIWIDPFLKPDNGFDDMYDTTYGLTRAAPSGVPIVATANNGDGTAQNVAGKHYKAAYVYGGPLSHPVPDCLNEGGEGVFSSHLINRDKIIVGTTASGSGTGLSKALSGLSEYADGFLFSQANSWNINNGGLMLHVMYCQNQVWTISPLRTSLLQARG